MGGDPKMKKYKLAYVGGTFDLLHPGHMEIFRKAKTIADFVIVSVNTDEFAKRYKGTYPAMTLRERMAMLNSCKWVDVVRVNHGGKDSTKAIMENHPDCIIHGDDWKGEGLMKQMGLTQEFLDKHGITLVYFPYTESISSTEIRERVIHDYIHNLVGPGAEGGSVKERKPCNKEL